MSKTIEQRLENVERELAELKGEIKTLIPRPNWISAITGTFKQPSGYSPVSADRQLIGRQLAARGVLDRVLADSRCPDDGRIGRMSVCLVPVAR